MKQRVVVTGACGRVAQRVLPGLSAHFDLTLVDVRDTTFDGEHVSDVHLIDLLNDDRSAYRELFGGHDAVLHSGFLRSADGGRAGTATGPETFRTEHDNVRMAFNVMQACMEADVPRLVVMSSNHAADFYEPLIHENEYFGVTPDTVPYSHKFYGWSKISYEALGFVFATGAQHGGKQLENVHLRIGAPRDTDVGEVATGDLRPMRRALAVYISERDEVQLIAKSITTPDIRNELGVPFQVFYGISGNSNRYWDISNAKRVIGYEPEDDSLVVFREEVARITAGVST
ncbi:MAG: NAD-dependent epimerase/dehydratase family protein [Spirochaetota bacterium]